MEQKKLLFIVNPISGTHDKQPIIDSLPRFLSADRFTWEVAWTDHKGHAAELAADAARRGVDVCVAIGGDGTVNEVASTLRHTNTALAIIPMGSGNGLARHLLIPMDPEGALRVLADCEIKELDYGTINEYPFFCTCGMGFDAFISEKFASAETRGLRTYVEKTLKDGLTYQPETYEVEIDGETTSYKAFLIACGNASQYGNNFYITPQASMSDGLLDVTIMEPFNVLEVPQIVLQMRNRTLNDNNHIRTFRCKQLHVHRAAPGVIHYDGDPAEAGTDIDIRLVPKGLRVVVVKELPAKDMPPVLHALQDLFDQINEDLYRQRRKIQVVNKSILRKLKM